MDNENEIRMAARKAVEYWTLQLQMDQSIYSDERVDMAVQKAVEYFTAKEPEKFRELQEQCPDLKGLFLSKLKENAPSEQQIERFKRELTQEILSDIRTRNCCYLYTEEDRAGGKLGLVTYRCGIKNDEKSLFRKGVEMFVTPGKVELRYDENARGLITYFDVKEAKLGGDGK